MCVWICAHDCVCPQRPEALAPLELELLAAVTCCHGCWEPNGFSAREALALITTALSLRGTRHRHMGSGYQSQVFWFVSKNFTNRAIILAACGFCRAFLSVQTLHGQRQTWPSAGWGTAGSSSSRQRGPTNNSLSMGEQTDVLT